MFRIFFTNHGYFHQNTHTTLDAAKKEAESHCFECNVYQNLGKICGDLPLANLVASYSPLYGWKDWEET